jgi:hypothetical protein
MQSEAAPLTNPIAIAGSLNIESRLSAIDEEYLEILKFLIDPVKLTIMSDLDTGDADYNSAGDADTDGNADGNSDAEADYDLAQDINNDDNEEEEDQDGGVEEDSLIFNPPITGQLVDMSPDTTGDVLSDIPSSTPTLDSVPDLRSMFEPSAPSTAARPVVAIENRSTTDSPTVVSTTQSRYALTAKGKKDAKSIEKLLPGISITRLPVPLPDANWDDLLSPGPGESVEQYDCRYKLTSILIGAAKLNPVAASVAAGMITNMVHLGARYEDRVEDALGAIIDQIVQ